MRTRAESSAAESSASETSEKSNSQISLAPANRRQSRYSTATARAHHSGTSAPLLRAWKSAMVRCLRFGSQSMLSAWPTPIALLLERLDDDLGLAHAGPA